MDVSHLATKYIQLLEELNSLPNYKSSSVTQLLMSSNITTSRIKNFYLNNSLVYTNELKINKTFDMNDNKHAAICGGVTEYLTKIKLIRRLGRSLDDLGFYNEKFKERYGHYNDKDIAFLL